MLRLTKIITFIYRDLGKVDLEYSPFELNVINYVKQK